MKKIILSMLAITTALSLAACAPKVSDNESGTNQTEIITISGSTSVEPLSNALGAYYMEANENVSVEVQGGGSSVGVTNIQDGVTDIGNVSRQLKDSEKELGLTENIIALDGIAIIVNAENTVAELQTEQIVAIFKGEITNWNQVGGEDMEIVVVGREAGSGTRGAFEEILKVSDECVYTVELNETGMVKNKVIAEKNAIGYVSLAALDDQVTALSVDGAQATPENIKSDIYKVYRPFIALTSDKTSNAANDFISFALSDEGQKIVEEKGFIKAN